MSLRPYLDSMWQFLTILDILLLFKGIDGMPENNISSCGALPWLHPCEPNGYDRMTPPQLYEDGKTTQVRVQIHIESIGNFKAGSMDYDMDIYFVEFWRDSRLRHNHSTYLSFNDRSQLDRLWQPDLYFANSKSAKYNYVTIPNYVLKIHQNGDCRFSIRVHLKISCHMNLKAYPIDKQVCYLKIVSYGSTTDKMQTRWVNDTAPITMNPDITDTDLKVDRVSEGYCDGAYFDMEFTCLLATFHLKRDIGYSLLQTYAPTTFIVVISWIAFWIDPNSVPGRVGLSVTALLTLSTHALGMHYQLPPVSYAKAQDVWFGVCIFFLFASLVEFALVNMYTRRADNLSQKVKVNWQKRKMSTKDTLIVCSGSENNNMNGSPSRPLIAAANHQDDHSSPSIMHVQMMEASSNYSRKAVLIDRYSRILFPIAFALFCVIYWCTYLLAIVG